MIESIVATAVGHGESLGGGPGGQGGVSTMFCSAMLAIVMELCMYGLLGWIERGCGLRFVILGFLEAC